MKPPFIRGYTHTRKVAETRKFMVEINIKISDKDMIGVIENALIGYLNDWPHAGVYPSTLVVKSGSKVLGRQKGLRTEIRKLRNNPVLSTVREVIDNPQPDVPIAEEPE